MNAGRAGTGTAKGERRGLGFVQDKSVGVYLVEVFPDWPTHVSLTGVEQKTMSSGERSVCGPSHWPGNGTNYRAGVSTYLDIPILFISSQAGTGGTNYRAGVKPILTLPSILILPILFISSQAGTGNMKQKHNRGIQGQVRVTFTPLNLPFMHAVNSSRPSTHEKAFPPQNRIQNVNSLYSTFSFVYVSTAASYQAWAFLGVRGICSVAELYHWGGDTPLCTSYISSAPLGPVKIVPLPHCSAFSSAPQSLKHHRYIE